MPLYEYDCVSCGAGFERITDGRQTVLCPECCHPECIRRFPLPAARRTETQTGADANREEDRKLGKRERMMEFHANEGKWGSSQRHD